MKPSPNTCAALLFVLLHTGSPAPLASSQPFGAAAAPRVSERHSGVPGVVGEPEPAPQKKTVRGALVKKSYPVYTIREAGGAEKKIRVVGTTEWVPKPGAQDTAGMFIEATGEENKQMELVAARVIYSGGGIVGLRGQDVRGKVKGVVVRRDADTFVMQDANGVNTTVAMTDRTNVRTKGGFMRSGTNYGMTAILRGLNLEVEGRGDDSDLVLVAEKIRFSESDLRTARTVEANVTPVENRLELAEHRVGQVEQNSQRLSGQLDELAAISNAARGGAKAAQETADAAVAGVTATNERISALDDYQVQNNTAILFRVGSSVLSRDAKTQLDQIAQQALSAKGYVLEVSGFASADGSTEANRRLSQRRADTVIRYLVENHNIPLRRIVTPYGYGEAQAVADNATREGREQNRRVEVKVLVNRGLIQDAPDMKAPQAEP